MDDNVQAELIELLKTGGRNLCTMPQILGMMLRQRCPDAESQIGELMHALTSGELAPLLNGVGPIDEAELHQRILERCAVTPERASWVVDSWNRALEAADRTPLVSKDWSKWNRLDVSTEMCGGLGASQRSLFQLLLVGAAGAMGGGSVGLILIGGRSLDDAWRQSLDGIQPGLQLAVLTGLGIVGGFSGGVLGHIGIGAQNWAQHSNGGATLGRIRLSMFGALVGGACGAAIGLAAFGLIGVALGAALGAIAGTVLGWMSAVAVSRFWP